MEPVKDFAGVRLWLCPAEGDVLETPGDTNDFLGEAWAHDADMAAIPVERLGKNFLNLSTGLAGEVTQKFVNYRVRMAIVGDISHATHNSGALRDYVYESNKGNHVWFVDSLDELYRRLSPSKAI